MTYSWREQGGGGFYPRLPMNTILGSLGARTAAELDEVAGLDDVILVDSVIAVALVLGRGGRGVVGDLEIVLHHRPGFLDLLPVEFGTGLLERRALDGRDLLATLLLHLVFLERVIDLVDRFRALGGLVGEVFDLGLLDVDLDLIGRFLFLLLAHPFFSLTRTLARDVLSIAR